MCTLSWQAAPDGLRIWFNRDEQRTRPLAEPPSQWSAGFLAPRDPAGGGTWIAADRRGRVYCLLNHYQASARPEHPRSRGNLIPALVSAGGDDPDAFLSALDLSPYPAFHLLVFQRGGLAMHQVWDGLRRERLDHRDLQQGMWTTSGWKPEQVLPFRHALWTQCGGEPEAQARFHWYHHDADPSWGPLMVREDASTVSITTIHVLPSRIDLTYTPLHNATPGSPVTCHLHV